MATRVRCGKIPIKSHKNLEGLDFCDVWELTFRSG